MKKTLTLIITLLFITTVYGQSNFGKIQGKVTDKNTKDPIAYATIMLEKDGIRKGGAYTDDNGKYAINALDPGTYKITVKYLDYSDKVITDIVVSSNSTKFLNIEMGQTEDGAAAITQVVVTAGRPMIEKDKNQQSLSSKDITKLPTRSLNAIAATSSAVTQTSAGLSFIGSRTDGTAYYVDGVRVVGSASVPQAAQGQIDIIQSGIPAQYGDFTGGAISVTTKGPSRYKARSFELISSSPFDPYHFNQAEFSSVGPLWIKNKGGGEDEIVAIGYQLAGNFNYTVDASPGYGGFYVVKDEVLEEIEKNPLTLNPNGAGLIFRSSLLNTDDLVKEKARRNVGRYFGNFQGKLEFQPNKNATISLFGSYNRGEGNNFQYSQSLMNYKENSMSTSQTLRTYLKFTQRLGSDDDGTDASADKKKQLFTGAFYNIRVDYQSSWSETQNRTHQDNYFDYGYLGKFTSKRSPFYQYVNDPTKHIDQNGDTVTRQGYYNLAAFFNTEIDFEASDKNEFRSNYTKNFFQDAEDRGQNVFSEFQILQGLGLLNGYNAGSTYGLWSNPGTVAYNYGRSQYERAAAYAQGEA
ncbi:MAG: TonB-dependent receptor, partial [Bacteroidia bacterium]|nr:TonB-dependent receptor [Bacteroidia bacterium]